MSRRALDRAGVRTEPGPRRPPRALLVERRGSVAGGPRPRPDPRAVRRSRWRRLLGGARLAVGARAPDRAIGPARGRAGVLDRRRAAPRHRASPGRPGRGRAGPGGSRRASRDAWRRPPEALLPPGGSAPGRAPRGGQALSLRGRRRLRRGPLSRVHAEPRLQGGPLDARQARAFERRAGWPDAIRLRRWDDAAKVPGLPVPGFGEYRTLLEDCLTSGEAGNVPPILRAPRGPVRIP